MFQAISSANIAICMQRLLCNLGASTLLKKTVSGLNLDQRLLRSTSSDEAENPFPHLAAAFEYGESRGRANCLTKYQDCHFSWRILGQLIRVLFTAEAVDL